MTSICLGQELGVILRTSFRMTTLTNTDNLHIVRNVCDGDANAARF
jgi:hypothetical protein